MHVIINGVSSETLQGVQVLSLPPITKPRMRTSVAVIDGRPGDIVTRLGYEAYNRKIQILLHHDYDIDAISAFFNTSGKIIFSNEPDMEYEFETIDAFSFERAVRYKTADITFHVQPYKLSATEEPATGDVSTLVDRTPYIIRRTPFGTRQKGSIVGGSIVWNQLIENGDFADGTEKWYTIRATSSVTNGVLTGTCNEAGTMYLNQYHALGRVGHVCFVCVDYMPSATGNIACSITRTTININSVFVDRNVAADQWVHKEALVRPDTVENGGSGFRIGYTTSVAVGDTLSIKNVMLIDLTLMFGPTIADYIYTQEQATAGAGVALAKAWAGITADYYPYDAGSIKSVEGLTAHRMTDGNGDVIGEYPLDSSLTLRGLPKLDGDSIYYDGDVYKADGTVERRYGVVDLGTLNWMAGTDNVFYSAGLSGSKAAGNFNIRCARYTTTTATTTSGIQDKECKGHGTYGYIYIRDTAYTDAASFKTAMSGVYLLYELAEPTTEQAEPYTALQICDPAGTEEFVGASMPVGHETTYIDPISMTVNNEGNTESAPSITIEGEGAVEVTVDGLNILQIQMPAFGEIAIDSKTLDATDGEGGLANRSVTGDYNDLRLAPGEHTVTVTGDVTSVTLRNTSRWI